MKGIKGIISNIKYGNRLVTAVRIFLGVLYIYSGFFKALDISGFAKIISLYDILPQALIPYTAIIIPFIELVTGLFLLIGLRIKASAFISILLLAVFTIAITINVVRGNTFNCGCFELERFGITEKVGVPLIIRDTVLLLLSILVCNAKRHFYSVDNFLEEDDLSNI
jgi:uncharacterized membrane protein YphA (DoxX/SURF4 family)